MPFSTLTPEQLAWIEDQMRRAANRAARKAHRRATVGFLILLVGVALALVDGQRQRDDADAKNRSLIVLIQKERERAIFDGCVDQNTRFTKFVAELDRQIAKLPPGQRRRSEAARDANIAILSRLAPRQNCFELVKKRAPTTSEKINEG